MLIMCLENKDWGGWLGSNVMKMWKGATNPVSGVSLPNPVGGLNLPNPGGFSIPNPVSGLSIPNPASGLSIPNPVGGLSIPNPVGGLSIPNPVSGMTSSNQAQDSSILGAEALGHHPTVEEANFLAQSSKDQNYSTVVDDELFNIPNGITFNKQLPFSICWILTLMISVSSRLRLPPGFCPS